MISRGPRSCFLVSTAAGDDFLKLAAEASKSGLPGPGIAHLVRSCAPPEAIRQVYEPLCVGCHAARRSCESGAGALRGEGDYAHRLCALLQQADTGSCLPGGYSFMRSGASWWPRSLRPTRSLPAPAASLSSSRWEGRARVRRVHSRSGQPARLRGRPLAGAAQRGRTVSGSPGKPVRSGFAVTVSGSDISRISASAASSPTSAIRPAGSASYHAVDDDGGCRRPGSA